MKSINQAVQDAQQNLAALRQDIHRITSYLAEHGADVSLEHDAPALAAILDAQEELEELSATVTVIQVNTGR